MGALIRTAVLLLLVMCAGPARTVPPHDLAELEAQAVRSLQVEYAYLIDPAADTSGLIGNTGNGCGERSAEERRNAIANRRAFNAQHGARFVEARVSLTGSAVRALDDGLALRTTERLDLVSETPTRRGDVTSAAIPHDFIFRMIAGRWLLVFDRVAGLGCRLPTL